MRGREIQKCLGAQRSQSSANVGKAILVEYYEAGALDTELTRQTFILPISHERSSSLER